jgi:hypothetical protein
MSTAAWIRAFDEMAFPCFQGTGMADMVTYTPLAGVAMDCRAYVEQGAEILDTYGVPIAANRIAVGLLCADVEQPQMGAAVVIDGESYVLDAQVVATSSGLRTDASICVWVVLPA